MRKATNRAYYRVQGKEEKKNEINTYQYYGKKILRENFKRILYKNEIKKIVFLLISNIIP